MIQVILVEGQQEVKSSVLATAYRCLLAAGLRSSHSLLGLRQAPPQRVLFQPDVSSTRQRNMSSHMHSPQPSSHAGGYSYNNPSSNPNSTSFSISNYEPRVQMPLTLRSVLTPGNNHPVFHEKMKQIQDIRAFNLGLKAGAAPAGMMLPGS